MNSIQPNKNNQLGQHIPTITLDDLHAWLGNITSKNTRQAYHKAVQDFIAWLNGKSLLEVIRRDCVDYRNELSANYSNATINQKLAGIRSLYNYLLDENVIDKNPCQNVKGLKVDKFGKSDALNVNKNQHIDLLVSIDTETNIGKRDYAIILLLMTTGLRVSALSNATLQDIKQDNDGVFLYFVNKGGNESKKELTGDTVIAIRDYLSTRTVSVDSPLFSTVQSNNPLYEFGKPMSRYAITKVVSSRCKAIGLHGITAHNLRHTTAMILNKNDVPLPDIQKQLNHKDRMTTLIYLDHLTDESNTKASEVLGSEFSNIIRKKDKK